MPRRRMFLFKNGLIFIFLYSKFGDSFGIYLTVQEATIKFREKYEASVQVFSVDEASSNRPR